MRTIPALLVTVGLVASLSACATGASAGSGDCTAPATGSASAAVTATGKLGSEPKVSVPADLTTNRTQVSVLEHGDGQRLDDGTPAVIEYTVVDGSTGKTVQTSGYDKSIAPLTVGSSNAGALGQALECSHVGDRLSIVMSKAALQGGKQTTKKQQDAVVVVADVIKAYPSRATGSPRIAKDGMPAVVLAPNGAPGITVPSTAAPKSDEVSLLRKGDGAELKDGQTALVKYTAVTWGKNSSVAGSSWTDGTGAVTVDLSKSGQTATAVRDALVGKHVGDQVLAIINQKDPTTGAATTYAYVFDVLGAL